MRARTDLWEPRGGNAPGPPGPLKFLIARKLPVGDGPTQAEKKRFVADLARTIA